MQEIASIIIQYILTNRDVGIMFISPARQLCMQVKQAADAGVKKVLK